MAKNISLLGADYPDVPAVQLPQTGGGTATFYDINVIDNLNSDSSTDALSAKQGKVLNEKIASLQLIKISKDVTIPDGTQTEQTVNVDVSDFIPAGKTIHSISDARLTNYVLPYSNTSGSQRTWIEQINPTTNIIKIKSTSTAWTNYSLTFIAFVQ